MAVGGGHRGVVAAASYEARKFGVRSAMPSVTAKRRCPELIFVKPRFDVYRAVSQQIRAIFADYTDLIEPLEPRRSLSRRDRGPARPGSARAIAEEIRARIKAETGLTASAGVSYCKFIAKLASDQNKPDGLCVIPPDKGRRVRRDACRSSASTASARLPRPRWRSSASIDRRRPRPLADRATWRRSSARRAAGTGESPAGSTSAR